MRTYVVVLVNAMIPNAWIYRLETVLCLSIKLSILQSLIFIPSHNKEALAAMLDAGTNVNSFVDEKGTCSLCEQQCLVLSGCLLFLQEV